MHSRFKHGVGLGVMALLAVGTLARAEDATVVLFDFEGGTQDWAIPDWAKQSPDYVGKIVSISEEFASHGKGSLQLLAEFPGGKWAGAYAEALMSVTDWSAFGSVSADVYVPAVAPRGLEARLILTLGDKWEWIEMNHAVPLEPGKWITITANLKPGSLDWKVFPTQAFRKVIRKLGIRVESNTKPVYSGPLLFDNVRLSP